jgi:hypothetical protein
VYDEIKCLERTASVKRVVAQVGAVKAVSRRPPTVRLWARGVRQVDIVELDVAAVVAQQRIPDDLARHAAEHKVALTCVLVLVLVAVADKNGLLVLALVLV